MTGPIYGEGWIIIRPDFSTFDTEVRHGIDRLLNDLSDEFTMFERYVADLFEDLADEIVFQMRYVDRVLNRIFNQIARDARECGYVIAASFTLASRIARDELDDLQDRAERAFANIRRASRGSASSMSNIFGGLFTRLIGLFSGLFSSGGQAGAGGANAASGIGSSLMSSLSGIGGSIGGILQIAVMAAIIPLLIQIAGAAINLAGALFALPAAAGVAAAAFIPLTIAFKGFGEALAAIWSGDPEKIDEALQKLAPHARVVAREFTKFVEPLKSIGKAIQQGFFVPLEGSLTKLGDTIVPALQRRIAGIGWSFGKVFAQIIDTVSTPQFTQAIEETILTAARIIERFGPSIANLLNGIIGLISKGLPYVERFAFWIASLIDKFSEWISKSTESGKVTGWLEQAWQAGKKFYAVIKELSTFIGLVFGSFGDEGQDTLGGMAESIAKINEYLRSSEGEETLHNLGVVIHWVGNAFNFLIGNMTVAYRALNLVFSVIRGIGPAVAKQYADWKERWRKFGNDIVVFWENIKRWFSEGWQWVVNLWNQSGDNLKRNSTNWWNSITGSISSFITRTKNAIVAFPGMLKQYIVDSIHRAAYNFGYAIGTIIKFILTLPDRAKAGGIALWNALVATWGAITNFFTETIPALAASVGQWFTDMWNTARERTTTFVSNAITTVSSLPGRVGDYITQTRDRVTARLQETRDRAIERVRGLVTGARDEASKLPDRVADAIRGVISKTYDIGRDMIYGMINGIKDSARALWNAARSVVLDAWQGAKDALQSKSPSKKWAELGYDSAAGYDVGFDKYGLTDAMTSAVQMPLDAFNRRNAQPPVVTNSVSVGGAQLVAYLQISDGQLQPVMVTTLKEHPQEVALAAQQGSTQLARRR